MSQSPRRLLVFLSVFLLSEANGIPVNYSSTICPPYNCTNGVNISYPFWHIDSKTSWSSSIFCGYPGFGLNCSDGEIILRLPNDDEYYVKNIDYTEYTLTLVDIDVTNQTCPRVQHNLTLDDVTLLNYTESDLNLTFFFNCSSYPSSLSLPLECLGFGTKRSYVFEVGQVPEGFDWYENCEDNVVVPVMRTAIESGRINGFGGVLQEGFQLDWRAARNCGVCENSGGLCGYKDTADNFLCFCPDGTRRSGNCYDLLQLGFFKFQMHPLLFSSSSFLVLCIFFIIFHVFPLCLCDGDERFSRCTPEFDCGNITGIGYPFWGNGRPKYCGHPGFELLDCQKDYPTTRIRGLEYRVMELNPVNQILRIARTDFMENICPPKLANSTLYGNLFDSLPSYMNLYLYYGCNFSLPLLPNRFTCSINDVPYEDAYVGSEVFPIEGNEGTCNVSIEVPILKTDMVLLAEFAVSLAGVLGKGFEVRWKVDAPCTVCKDSGGRCGYDLISKQPTCFCPDQSYASTCSTPRPTPVAAPAPKSEFESESGSGTCPLFILFIVLVG
ncbi:hypothetical protein HHK36_014946 [Tetracentron sinense]|uniref:Uncharacterized protein n=1 Tax=Tetracentron sinense TaxID=13715 RepID=A0A834Z256_TETSI|nr:hypothetical protein HHK36_014946 [Tetracentron sinense]